MFYKKYMFWVVFFFLHIFYAYSQELPPIQNFTPEDYHGDNQNWMISQSKEKFIYVANNKGLLEFNGSEWVLYPSPNNSIIRAVNAIDNKIYTACYMEFGYWSKNSIGKLEYVSLVPNLDEKLVEDEQFWSIIHHNEWVIFQSTNKIYFYSTINKKFKIIKSDNIIFKIFEIDGVIYYQVQEEGIYKIENGKPKLIISDPIINNKKLVNIFEINNELIFLTNGSGFYRLENDAIVPWGTPANNVLKNKNIFCGLQLTNESIIIGTISNGIINLKSDGSVNYQITQRNGLNNNTVLALFEDVDNNLWVGLDNGINCINITSPINVYYDYEGVLGTVYVSKVFKDYMYLGTNQGLFYKKIDSKDAYKFMEGTGGQVWDLYNYNNEDLLCGHHLGTYSIDVNKADLIDSNFGTWAFKPLPQNNNYLLKGNYNGLSILEKNSGTWKVRNKIDGFNSSSRFIELDNSNNVWVSHEYKGIYKIKLNDSLTKAVKVDLESSLSIGKNSSLIKYKGDIYYAYEKGIFRYDTIRAVFTYDSILSPIIEKENYISGKLIVDKKNRLWAFSKENIQYVTTDQITNKPKINTISIPSNLRKGTLSFENISPIHDETYLLGIANGYLTIDLSKIDYNNDYTIYLNAVNLKDVDGGLVDFDTNKNGEFNFKSGILLFNFSVPHYDKFLEVKYQYKLEGYLNKWSEWSNESKVRYENLGFGNYTLKVRAKIGENLSKNTITYSFDVLRPWYLSNAALSLYSLLFLLIMYITHKMYKRYYHKKYLHQQSESEKLIIQIKNEQLNQDVENKNRELTISKMSIIRKNKLLSGIKKELEDEVLSKNVNSVIRLIDKNLNNTKDWELFVRAFNNTDKGFLDKMKSLHPNLTPSDLRFCVYLRLNLSSKEISPLLNISVKSVETKRYRLRKRMNLPHEESLVNYILSI